MSDDMILIREAVRPVRSQGRYAPKMDAHPGSRTRRSAAPF